MKFTFKFLIVLCVFISALFLAQTSKKTLDSAKKIIENKNDFIGKPLSYLLKNIKGDIMSVIPFPNKNLKEVNRIGFLFVSSEEYRKSPSNYSEKPLRITAIFNQNWDFVGEPCRYYMDCAQWTKEDVKTLGDLIIYDIYVTGK